MTTTTNKSTRNQKTFVAVWGGKAYKRTSISKDYGGGWAVVGRKWRKWDTKFLGCSRTGRGRARFEVVVDRSKGMEDAWELLGFRTDHKAAVSLAGDKVYGETKILPVYTVAKLDRMNRRVLGDLIEAFHRYSYATARSIHRLTGQGRETVEAALAALVEIDYARELKSSDGGVSYSPTIRGLHAAMAYGVAEWLASDLINDHDRAAAHGIES